MSLPKLAGHIQVPGVGGRTLRDQLQADARRQEGHLIGRQIEDAITPAHGLQLLLLKRHAWR